MTPTTSAPPPVFPELAGTRQFTSDEYQRMLADGVLGADEKVELRDGYVV